MDRSSEADPLSAFACSGGTYLVGGTMEIGYEEDAPAPAPAPASLKSNCLCPEAGDNSAIMVETV